MQITQLINPTINPSTSGSLPLINSLHIKDINIEQLIKHNHMHIIKHLHQTEKLKLNTELPLKAARAGNIECLTYLQENGCPWDEGCFEEAVRSGYFGPAIYLIGSGYRVTIESMERLCFWKMDREHGDLNDEERLRLKRHHNRYIRQ